MEGYSRKAVIRSPDPTALTRGTNNSDQKKKAALSNRGFKLRVRNIGKTTGSLAGSMQKTEYSTVKVIAR